MLRLLIDQDLDHDILRGLIRRVPNLEAVTALEIGMSQASDPELLVWAAQERRHRNARPQDNADPRRRSHN